MLDFFSNYCIDGDSFDNPDICIDVSKDLVDEPDSLVNSYNDWDASFFGSKDESEACIDVFYD